MTPDIKPRLRATASALETWLQPLVLLGLRLWIGKIFFQSGQTKIANWDQTTMLFENVYRIGEILPFLPVGVAAGLATATELATPVLLALGLLTRLAAVPMLIMTLVIQFGLGSVDANFDLYEHYAWMLILLLLIARGPGILSVDALIAKRWRDR